MPSFHAVLNAGGNVRDMRSPWQILRDGGLPLAIEGTGGFATASELAAATRATVAEAPTGRDGEALAAFVFAWHHHRPRVFEGMFGAAGAGLLAWAAQQFSDDGRYLKLRRIAIENLAHVL
jgi:hypothetical protein